MHKQNLITRTKEILESHRSFKHPFHDLQVAKEVKSTKKTK